MPYISGKSQNCQVDGIISSPIIILNTSNKTMNYLKLVVGNFIKREDGPTAVEYAIMLALIVVVCIAAVGAIGQGARDVFQSVADVF